LIGLAGHEFEGVVCFFGGGIEFPLAFADGGVETGCFSFGFGPLLGDGLVFFGEQAYSVDAFGAFSGV
jgi:hypothetical protein